MTLNNITLADILFRMRSTYNQKTKLTCTFVLPTGLSYTAQKTVSTFMLRMMDIPCRMFVDRFEIIDKRTLGVECTYSLTIEELLQFGTITDEKLSQILKGTIK